MVLVCLLVANQRPGGVKPGRGEWVELWMLMERRFAFDLRLDSEVEMLSCDSLACFTGLFKETFDKPKLFLHFCCH